MKKRLMSLLAIVALFTVSAWAQMPPVVADTTKGFPADSAATVADSISVVAPEAESLSLLEKVENWYADNMNYGSIIALMTIESSFIPFPSEVVVPPAAYVAGNPESSLYVTDNYPFNVFLVVLFGTIGAILGAIVNYLLSVWLGRPIIYAFADSKVGHLLLLSSAKIRKAEDYFNDHGKVSTFVGRLIPGIRQLISIPAGLAKMHFGWFLLYTFLGAFLWNVILALLGYIAHGQMDLIHRYSDELSVAILVLLGAVILWFVGRAIVRRCKKKKGTVAASPEK